MLTRAAKPLSTFAGGLLSVAHAFGHLARLPKAWGYALVPALVFLILASLGVYAAFTWLEPFVKGLLPEATSWYGRFGSTVVSQLAALLASLSAVLLAQVLTPPISAPALERIVGIVERDLGAPPRASLGFFREIWCGFRALAAGALFFVPIGLVLWIVDFVFPPAAIVTVPLKVLLTGFVVAWNLVDYPLTLSGMRVRERFALIKRELYGFLGFGLGFAALFWLPCCGIVCLPIGVVAATRLAAKWRGQMTGAA
jgi:CysZ protein